MSTSTETEFTVVTWYEAGAEIKRVQDLCEAFIRGDQQEKIEHLSLEEVQELRSRVCAVLNFCVTATTRGVRRELPYRDYDTFTKARQYTRNLTNVLLLRDDLDTETHAGLENWVQPDLPEVQYEWAM